MVDDRGREGLTRPSGFEQLYLIPNKLLGPGVAITSSSSKSTPRSSVEWSASSAFTPRVASFADVTSDSNSRGASLWGPKAPGLLPEGHPPRGVSRHACMAARFETWFNDPFPSCQTGLLVIPNPSRTSLRAREVPWRLPAPTVGPCAEAFEVVREGRFLDAQAGGA